MVAVFFFLQLDIGKWQKTNLVTQTSHSAADEMDQRRKMIAAKDGHNSNVLKHFSTHHD